MWQFGVRNIGGIREGETSLTPGINTIQADNWEGKSSFISAIQTVMGTTGVDGSDHPLTEGATNGEVTLETDDEIYTTVLRREGPAVTREGDTYLTDMEDRACARLFAFLGEDNPVRAAVRNDGDLADLLGRPLALENIDEQISQLQRKRREMETDLDEAERAAKQLPNIQEDITQLEDELNDLRDEYDELTAESEERADQSDLRDELSSKRATRNQLEGDIDRIENAIKRRESRLESKRGELKELQVPDELDIEGDIDEKQARIAELRTQIELLEDIHSANKRVLDENQFQLVTDVEQSIAGDEITCWTCGATTPEEDFEEQLEEFRVEIRDRRAQRERLEAEVEDIQERRNEIERKQRRRRSLEDEISELEADLEESRREIADRRKRLENVTEEIEDLEARVQETDDHLTDLKSEIKVKEQELDQKHEKLTSLEEKKTDRADLQEEYEHLGEEIDALRTRKKDKQYELAERFEDAMEDIIDRFQPGFESARLDPKTTADNEVVDYELIVARDGREADLNALSEGELELLGIVTALAGYQTFDVADRVPAILLDDMGSLSGGRIQSLVEYLNDEAEYLVTTAYPESGDFQGNAILPSEWDVVSDRTATAS